MCSLISIGISFEDMERILSNIYVKFNSYCKRANIRGGFNFAMFAVHNFSAKLKPPRSFSNTSVYSYLLLHVHLKV